MAKLDKSDQVSFPDFPNFKPKKVGGIIRNTPPGFKPFPKEKRPVGRPRDPRNHIGLTGKEQLFADLILENMHRSKKERRTKLQCWRESHQNFKCKDNSASVYASKLFHNKKIQSYIQERKKAAAGRVEIKIADVLKGLLRIANFDVRKLFDSKGKLIPVHKLDDETALAITGMKFQKVAKRTPTGRKSIVYYPKEYKNESRKAAWELIGNHLNMFNNFNNETTAEDFVNEMRDFADSVSGMIPGGQV